MKEKIKTTSFWLGLSGAFVIIADCISEIFNISMFSDKVNTIVMSVCSVLVVLGIVTKKKVTDKGESTKEELLYELKEIDGDIEIEDVNFDSDKENNN